MWRLLFPALLCCILMCSPALAIIELTMEGVPNSFVPGDSFTFQVRMAGAVDMTDYNVAVDLWSTDPNDTAGSNPLGPAPGLPVDFEFDHGLPGVTGPVPVARPDPGRYVFDGHFIPSFQLMFGFTGTKSHFGTDLDADGLPDIYDLVELNLYDFLLVSPAPGVFTLDGANDLLAELTVTTSTSMVGDLRLGFATDVLVIRNSFGEDQSGDVDPPVVQESQLVPEPASLMIWSLLGALGLACAWRRRKRDA